MRLKWQLRLWSGTWNGTSIADRTVQNALYIKMGKYTDRRQVFTYQVLLAIDQWSMAWTYWKVPYRPLRQQWWIYYILSVWCINDDIKHNINFTKQSPLKWLIKIIFEWRLNTADIKPCSKNRNTVVLIIYTICKLCPIIQYR